MPTGSSSKIEEPADKHHQLEGRSDLCQGCPGHDIRSVGEVLPFAQLQHLSNCICEWFDVARSMPQHIDHAECL